MKKIFVFSTIVCLFISSFASADTFGTGANQFEIEFVTISGDTNPMSGYGIVSNDYRMGTYEITNDQWNKFINIHGSPIGSETDPWNGTSAYDKISIYSTDPYMPTNNSSWYEAVQFVNWLNTSTGHQVAYKFTGTQGTSDYTFTVWDVTDDGYNAANPFRNSNAYYFLPTEDEWVKAAYWNGTNLQTWATIGDVEPPKGSSGWNYDDALEYPTYVGHLWNVGSGSEELNGTFDMMGNVREWLESPFYPGEYLPSSYRGIRGGSCTSHISWLDSSGTDFNPPGCEFGTLGFRIASIPEPASAILLVVGAGLLRFGRRKR